MKIELPEKVKKILSILTEAGFEAFAVGGCIRDSILGKTPDDWDITTSATPQQVKGLFRYTIDTGIQHGTVTIMLEKEAFEVTTYRIDGKYEDNRHPKEVVFTPSLEEDLKRRDFTINAMAYNEQKGLVDLFGGIADIEAGVIRCVGDAGERFQEDALRMMRAIRFSAQLGYQIEPQTKEAIQKLAPNLAQISAERIQVELVKLLCSNHPDYLRLAYDTGITAIVLPEWDAAMDTPQKHPHHCYSVGEHTLHALLEVPPNKVLRLAVLLHDIGKPSTFSLDKKGITHFKGHVIDSVKITDEILLRLRFDNNTIERVKKLVQYHDYGNGVVPDKRMVRRAMHHIGAEYMPDLFQIKKADILSQSKEFQQEKLEALASWEKLYNEIIQEKECVSLKELAVTGKDLIALGMKPGREMGNTLNRLLDLVLDHPECNNKEYLLSKVKNS